jgi:hypothetical protein
VLASKADHSIAMMCRVLEVWPSGCHAWATRPPSAKAVQDYVPEPPHSASSG